MSEKHPNFQRRHHERVAAILKRAAARARHNDTPAEVVSDLVEEFADLFAGDNGTFKRGPFYMGCDPAVRS